MRYICFMLMVFSLADCRRNGVPEFAPHSEPTDLTAAALKSCPNGHSQLREVPIFYGLPTAFAKDKSEWTDNDRELVRKMDAGEIIWGGCVVDSRKIDLSCRVCGFRAYALGPKGEGPVLWSRSGPLSEPRGRTFSPFGASFPIPASSVPNSEVTSEQSLEEGEILSESIGFRLPVRDRALMIARIREWASKVKLQPVDHSHDSDAKFRLLSATVSIGNERRSLDVDVANIQDQATTFFRMTIDTSSSPIDEIVGSKTDSRAKNGVEDPVVNRLR